MRNKCVEKRHMPGTPNSWSSPIKVGFLVDFFVKFCVLFICFPKSLYPECDPDSKRATLYHIESIKAIYFHQYSFGTGQISVGYFWAANLDLMILGRYLKNLK